MNAELILKLIVDAAIVGAAYWLGWVVGRGRGRNDGVEMMSTVLALEMPDLWSQVSGGLKEMKQDMRGE